MTPERLYEENQRLAVHWVYRILRRYDEDMHTVAEMALWQAAQAFDESRGRQFTTLASAYIRGAIIRAIQSGEFDTVRIPRHHHERGDRPPACCGLDAVAETGAYDELDEETLICRAETAMRESRLLSKKVMDTLSEVIRGAGCAEIARREGVTTQCVSSRVRKAQSLLSQSAQFRDLWALHVGGAIEV